MITLGDICAKGSSNIAQKDLEGHDGAYPIYGASGLIKYVDFYQQEKPYVAVVKDGAGVGRVMQLPGKSSVIGTMQYILPNPDINVSYLAYALEHMNLAKYYTGATIPHIYFKDYCKEILPPHNSDERHRIAGVLDKLSDLISLRKQQLAKLDELAKARFVEMFGATQNDAFGYECSPLDDVAITFFAGGDKPEDCSSVQDKEHPFPVYANGYENYGLQGYSSECRVKDRAVTISARGTIGYCFIREANFTPIVRLITIVPNDKVSVEYLKYAIDTMQINGSGTSQAQLTVPDFKKEIIVVPPISVQKEFVAFVAHIEQLKLTIQQSLDKLEVLKRSLMQQYFV